MATVILFLDLKGPEIRGDIRYLILLVYFLNFLKLFLVNEFSSRIVYILLIIEEHLIHSLLFLNQHLLITFLLFNSVFIVNLQFHLFLFLQTGLVI